MHRGAALMMTVRQVLTLTVTLTLTLTLILTLTLTLTPVHKEIVHQAFSSYRIQILPTMWMDEPGQG